MQKFINPLKNEQGYFLIISTLMLLGLLLMLLFLSLSTWVPATMGYGR